MIGEPRETRVNYFKLLSGKELIDLCDEFRYYVEEGYYDKVEYNKWRQMIKIDPNAIIKLNWFTDHIDEKCYIDMDCDTYWWHFNSWDVSFGTFLYEKQLGIYEDDIDSLKNPDSSYKIIEHDSFPLYDLDTSIGLNNYGSCVGLDGAKCDYTISSSITDEMDNVKAAIATLTVNSEEASKSLKKLQEQLKDKIEIKLEENKVMMKGFNFEFGPLNAHLAKMSMYGLAIKNKNGVYVSYNAATEELIDVDVFNFDGSQFLYRIPVAIKDIKVGDVVIHNNTPMFVVRVPEDGKTLVVIDPCSGERKEILLTRSPFGFNFATKIVNFLGDMFNGVAPSAENPFGNMWMLMMMGDETKGMDKMLPMMLMMNQGNAAMDPTMMMTMMCMMDGKSTDSMLPMMWAMQNMNKPAAAPHVCTCGGHCNGGETA